MAHPLSSLHLDAALERRSNSLEEMADSNVEHAAASNSRRASVASRTTADEEQEQLKRHLPGVAAPLSLKDEDRLDIEKSTATYGRWSPPLSPLSLSSHAAGKQRSMHNSNIRKPEPALSAARGSLTAASHRPGPGPDVADNGDGQHWLDIATSPLHIDISTIPPANMMAQMSPEDQYAPNDAYAMGHVTPAAEESDPLLLRSRIIDTDQELRRRPSKGRRADKRVRNYYERQNTLIENLLKPIAKHASEDEDETEAADGMVKFLIYLNIGANFVLAGLQLYAAISSLSLSLFATAADSVFDPFANLLLNWLHRKSTRLDERKWPIGGSRMENAGNIAYAGIMGCVSVVLIVESARDIGSHKAGETNTLYYPSLIAVGIAFLTKAVLGVMNYMYRKHSSQLDMLWVDCRNDLFINGFGIFTSAAGAKIAWWIDPVGAIVISFGIIFAWSRAASEQFRELCGVAAPVEFLQLCTYNALHIHYEHIEMIDSVKAYHSGPKYIVEVDIVMKPETPLWLSHNVSQDLQDKIEQLPMCERAFVHVDFEVDHRPEHQAAKKVK